MWPLKAHYCLWFGSLSGILPYVSVFAKTHLGMSATAVGVLFSVLPFVVSIGKPLACSAADHYGKHSQALLLSQVLALLGYGLLLVIPFVLSLVSSQVLWWLFCLLALIGNTAMGVGISLTDFLVMNEVNQINQQGGNTNYGSFRIWGTIGFGFFGILSGIINQNSADLPYLLPGLIMFVAIESLDIVCIYQFYHLPRKGAVSDRIAFHQVENFQISKTDDGEFITNGNSHIDHDSEPYVSTTQNMPRIVCKPIWSRLWDNLKETTSASISILQQILRIFYHYPSLLQHCFIIFFFGILTALHWSFFFWFLEEIRGKDSLLMGLCIFVNSFVGEIPIFLIAHRIIQWVGPILSLCLSLSAFALRYLCYGYLLEKQPGKYWDVLLIETLQGLTFSLFYTVMTQVAQYYADKCDKIAATESSVLVAAENGGHPNELSSSRQSSIDDEAEGEFESNISGQTKMNSLRPKVVTEPERKIAKPSATMQGLTSGCYEGLGLGVGSLTGGYLIDQLSMVSIWRIAGFLSLVLVAFNIVIELIKFIVRKRKREQLVQ